MKVLLLTPSLAKPGGIQRYTLTLQRALKDLVGDQSVRCLELIEDPAWQGSPRLSSRSKWRFGREAVRESARWRPDLTICTHLALGPVGWMSAGLRPYWIVVHGIEAWVPLPLAKRMALRRADRVIVTSRLNLEQVTKAQRVKAERIASLPCALDEVLTTVEPAGSGPHDLLNGGQSVILTVARMLSSERYKGHDVILQALPIVLKRVPNLTYVIVGEGDDQSRIQALAQDLGLGSHVVFTGSVSDPELVAIYRRSDVFALPARTVINSNEAKGEGFGIVFLEAMAFGKPVIGPNFGAPAEFIRDGENGLLVDPDSVTSVAGALVDLLTNPEKGRELGKAGREGVRRSYSYSSFCERLVGLLPS